MPVTLNRIGQIALAVRDVDIAEAFYQDKLGLRKLYRFGDLTFFDCAGVRLLLEKAHDPDSVGRGAVVYFACADIPLTMRELQGRGIIFDGPAHRIAKMDDHDLWMAFFHDPDGNTLALMQEAPVGYDPVGD